MSPFKKINNLKDDKDKKNIKNYYFKRGFLVFNSFVS